MLKIPENPTPVNLQFAEGKEKSPSLTANSRDAYTNKLQYAIRKAAALNALLFALGEFDRSLE